MRQPSTFMRQYFQKIFQLPDTAPNHHHQRGKSLAHINTHTHKYSRTRIFSYLTEGSCRDRKKIYMKYFCCKFRHSGAQCSLNISLFRAILCVYYTAARFITADSDLPNCKFRESSSIAEASGRRSGFIKLSRFLR